jgi:Protein of unknown function (DUF1761)
MAFTVLSINIFAVMVAAISAFVEGALWNSPLIFGNARIKLAGLDPVTEMKGSPAKPLAELIRCLVVAFVLAQVLRIARIADPWAALGMAALIWFGFQAAFLAGGIIWERLPPKLYAIHVGDALVKILLMAAILGVWR